MQSFRPRVCQATVYLSGFAAPQQLFSSHTLGRELRRLVFLFNTSSNGTDAPRRASFGFSHGTDTPRTCSLWPSGNGTDIVAGRAGGQTTNNYNGTDTATHAELSYLVSIEHFQRFSRVVQ